MGIEELEREGLQARLIYEIFASCVRREFILKGGLAMRALHGSVRVTKDIDLDSPPEIPVDHARARMRGAIKKALEGGCLIEAQVTEPKQTETVMRWKINGLTRRGSRIHLTVEVSRRGMPLADRVEERDYPAPEGISGACSPKAPAKALVYASDAIAAMKVFALASENRVAPRDIYDLNVLIEAGIEPAPDLLRRLGEQEIEQALSRSWAKIDLMDWKMFRSEVLPTLPPAEASRFTEEEFDRIRMRVGEKVESWLTAARGPHP